MKTEYYYRVSLHYSILQLYYTSANIEKCKKKGYATLNVLKFYDILTNMPSK